MEQNSQLDFSKYSDSELKKIVITRVHRGAIITAAKKEMNNRGIILSPDELNQLEKVKKTRIKDSNSSKSVLKEFWNQYSDNIVSDESAPQLYSRRVLYLFALLFFPN